MNIVITNGIHIKPKVFQSLSEIVKIENVIKKVLEKMLNLNNRFLCVNFERPI